MSDEKQLYRLEAGESAVVKALFTADSMRRRFMDIGLIDGTKVTCEIKGRGISAYLIRGALIAIRQEDAESVLVETVAD